MYAFLSVLFTFGILIYSFDGHTILKDAVLTRYRRFRQLNQLVGTRYKTISSILWVSCCMVAKMYWINFLHWANNSIEYLDHKTAVISYILNGKLYRMVVTPKRGPINVLLVTDDGQNDVSDIVIPFMGPNHDWHGREYTPSFWKKNSLTFELASGESKTFHENQPIQIPN